MTNIWTGDGVIRIKKKDYFPGDEIPEIDEKQFKQLKADKQIGGKVSDAIEKKVSEEKKVVKVEKIEKSQDEIIKEYEDLELEIEKLNPKKDKKQIEELQLKLSELQEQWEKAGK